MIHKKLTENVMHMLLEGENEILANLRLQYAHSNIKSEEVSNVGFYVNFSIDNKLLKVNTINQNFHIGDVDGNVDGIESAVGFILYIKNGLIHMLEGYTNIVNEWPKDDSLIILTYDGGNKRNYNSLISKLVK